MDAYRTRWVIEEFFKALKSGCKSSGVSSSFQSVENALAIFLPIAVRLPALRGAARAACPPQKLEIDHGEGEEPPGRKSYRWCEPPGTGMRSPHGM